MVFRLVFVRSLREFSLCCWSSLVFPVPVWMFTLSSACLFLFKDPVSSLHFTGSCCVPVSPRHLRIYPFSSHHHGIRVAHLLPALPGIYGLSIECWTTFSTCSFNKIEFLHLHLLSSLPVTVCPCLYYIVGTKCPHKNSKT